MPVGANRNRLQTSRNGLAAGKLWYNSKATRWSGQLRPHGEWSYHGKVVKYERATTYNGVHVIIGNRVTTWDANYGRQRERQLSPTQNIPHTNTSGQREDGKAMSLSVETTTCSTSPWEDQPLC